MLAPETRRISQLDGVPNLASAITGGLLEMSLRIGPGGSLKSVQVTYEQLHQVLSAGLPAITLDEAQALTPAFTLYAIASYPDPYTQPDVPPPTWNGDPAQRIVLVQGLPGGKWASQGVLVTDSGSKRVQVNVADGIYTAEAAVGAERDIYAVPDAVRDAVRHPGNTWAYGDLTAYNDAARLSAGAPPAVAGQPGNVLVGTAAIGGGHTFDAFEVNSTTVAWRYTYCRRNDGTYGWTRLGKTA